MHSLGTMRLAALLVWVMAMGCSKTYIVSGDGGALCAPGFALCTAEPASIDGVPTGDAGLVSNPVTSYPLLCADLETDDDNCGGCGKSCGVRGCDGGRCGACLPSGGAPPSECYTDADCCSGKCKAMHGAVGFGLCE